MDNIRYRKTMAEAYLEVLGLQEAMAVAVKTANKITKNIRYAGSLDKRDFNRVAKSLEQVNAPSALKAIGKFIMTLDTSPRDFLRGTVALNMGEKAYYIMFGERLTQSGIRSWKSIVPKVMWKEDEKENIKQAIEIAKKMGGNHTGAVKEIETIAKGLSDHPKVSDALRKANESLEEINEKFSDSQIARLKKEYEPLKGKETGVNPEKFAKLRKMLRKMSKDMLLQLVQAGLPLVSSGAKAVLVVHHGMKWSQLDRGQLDMEIDMGEKFVDVDDKVMKRIELMMKGTREMKNSIQNMLNYLMPPEVVDMVKDKFGIKEPRGKIKIR